MYSQDKHIFMCRKKGIDCKKQFYFNYMDARSTLGKTSKLSVALYMYYSLTTKISDECKAWASPTNRPQPKVIITIIYNNKG